jgi:hypothetical protein
MERVVPDLLKTHATAQRLHTLSFGFRQRHYTLSGWSEACPVTRPVIDLRLGAMDSDEEALSATATALNKFGNHVQTLTLDRWPILDEAGHSPFATLEHVSRVNAVGTAVTHLAACLAIVAEDKSLTWPYLTHLDVSRGHVTNDAIRSLEEVLLASDRRLAVLKVQKGNEIVSSVADVVESVPFTVESSLFHLSETMEELVNEFSKCAWMSLLT